MAQQPIPTDIRRQALADCLTTIGQALITYGRALSTDPLDSKEQAPDSTPLTGTSASVLPLPAILTRALEVFDATQDTRLHSAGSRGGRPRTAPTPAPRPSRAGTGQTGARCAPRRTAGT
ncbi:hypothetical protein ABZU75_41435 [Streptosporangium sp. NPDC005286]|uniref:hypothetical protein n=1 Tax=Streptosporangium sp. NPDC005286 TaxID=3154463 RepID=UPI0033B6C310